MKFISKIVLFGMGLLLPFASIAASARGIGDVASDLMEPVAILSNLMGSAAIIIGIFCLFASFLRYMQYRVNPLASPISTVITLLILGILLVCLPLIYKLTVDGIPYTFHL